MDDLATRYAAWKAPREDGGTLLWPAPVRFLADARDNNRRLGFARDVRVQNTPLPELRRAARLFLGVDADDQLVIANGHQTELHHPGVWAKNALADAAARACDGVAMHVAVDTDAPKHLSLKFPGFAEPFTDDPAAASAKWAGLVAPPSPAHLASLADAVGRASAHWPFEPMLPQLFDLLRRQSLDAEHLPKLLTAALHEFDWGLGLRYSALLASPIWASEPYLALAHHVLANAERFAADYNAALHAYRVRQNIHAPGRPMPDLASQGDRLETPFWRDDLAAGDRARAWVERAEDCWALSAGDDRFLFDPRTDGLEAAGRLGMWLRRHRLRLSPRALTLTMSLRLLVADQFVHGIGGGQYDQVTDDVIARHFGIEPPRFAVTTATLYWPPAAGRQRTDIAQIAREGHRLRHGLLGPRKRELVAAIDAAPWKSRERQERFQAMQRALKEAAAASGAVAEWQARLREAASRQAEEQAIFDRELFYAVQPRERLERVIGAYREMFR